MFDIDLADLYCIETRSFPGGAIPVPFSGQGVAMLSSVLRSKRAIMVNIVIMRAFVNLRRLIDANKDSIRRIDSLEEKYDKKFKLVCEAIKELIRQENEPREKIG